MRAESFPGRSGGLLRRLFGISEPPAKIRLTTPAISTTAFGNDACETPTRKKILIIDDDDVVVKTTAMRLQAAGYSVVTANDGSSAIQAARHERPDLILLDLSFPPDVAHGGGVPWDGFLIMYWLRRFEEVNQVPVIVITGTEPAGNKDHSLANGAIAYFQKPLDHSALLSAIKEAIKDEPTVQEPKLVANFQV
jgi:CheY-like chemotaxis protein